MRGRILMMGMVVLATAAMLAACSKRDSLYIEPGKNDHPATAQPTNTEPGAAEPARP